MQFRDFALPEDLRQLHSAEWIDVAVDVYAELAQRANIVRENAAATMVSTASNAVFEDAPGSAA